jgi:hypothetical protein
LLKGLTTDDLSRTFVSNTKNNIPTPTVGDGARILDELIEFKGSLRLFELDILAFFRFK